MTRPARPAAFAAVATTFLLGGLATLPATPAHAQRPEPDPERAAHIRAHYSKFEHRLPMRDGVRLFTAVYAPNEPGEYPILLQRTPYDVGPYGASRYMERLGPSAEYERDGYIFVFQDVRGKYMSEGEFVNMRPHRSVSGAEVDESTDTWDTIEWLVANVPGNNGRVGLWGLSYPGFYAAAGMIDSHPALKAVAPMAPIADWFFDDMHHHGAFVLNLSFGFFSSFGQPRAEPTTERAERFDFETVDGYQFFLDLGPLSNADGRHFEGGVPFWNEIVAHPNYDAFWQSRNLLPHLDGITAAVMIVGGWFDMEDLYGPLNIYRSVEEKNPGTTNTLVMGPWRHGGWLRGDGSSLGSADFGFPTAGTYREQAELAFFRHHLKGDGSGDPGLPEALVFETGANRWRRFDAWPPPEREERRLHLGAGGALTFAAPSGTGPEAADSYPSDPARPVPYTQTITTRWHPEFMVEDQRFAARRPDVLVYETPPLEEDLTLAGPLTADLWVSTTGEDADWVVKLIDVFPPEHPDAGEEPEKEALGGQQMLVRAEVIRGRFRNSYEHPEPFVPGEPTRVSFPLQDVLHTFQRGHRVMVQVQSSWFPLIDRNPQSWVPNIFQAEEDDFVRATHTVYRSPEMASGLVVGVLPGTGRWTSTTSDFVTDESSSVPPAASEGQEVASP